MFVVCLVGELVGWMVVWVWLPCASLSVSQYKLRYQVSDLQDVFSMLNFGFLPFLGD